MEAVTAPCAEQTWSLANRAGRKRKTTSPAPVPRRKRENTARRGSPRGGGRPGATQHPAPAFSCRGLAPTERGVHHSYGFDTWVGTGVSRARTREGLLRDHGAIWGCSAGTRLFARRGWGSGGGSGKCPELGLQRPVLHPRLLGETGRGARSRAAAAAGPGATRRE